MKKIIVMALALAMIASVLSGCGGKPNSPTSSNPSFSASTPSSTPSGERTIKDSVSVVLNSEPSGMDPQQANQTNSFTMMMQVYDNLVTIDEQGNPQPSLATSWEQIDETTTRFHLRDDVYFHNGEKMTAEDVRFTIERATLLPNSASMYASFDGEKTAVVDETTIDIVTKAPFAPLFAYLSMPRAMIVCKSAIEELGDDGALHNPIGTGAFKFVDWQSGISVSMTRNEQYWGSAPAYTNLQFRFVTETASRVIEVETGNADLAFNPDVSDVERLTGSSSVNVVTSPAYGGLTLYLNASGTDPVTADYRVRQAIAHAIDIPTIAEVVYGSLGSAAQGVFPASFAYSVPLDLYEYNPNRAHELLTEADYGQGEAELTFMVIPNNFVQSASEMMANMLTQAGFKVNLIQQDINATISDARDYKYSGWPCSWTYGASDLGFPCNDFAPDYTANTSYAFDDKLTELKQAGLAALDTTERAAIYKEYQERLYIEDLQCIHLVDSNQAYLTTANVTNFNGSFTGSPYLGDIIVYE